MEHNSTAIAEHCYLLFGMVDTPNELKYDFLLVHSVEYVTCSTAL
jgi:hypothetical protein